jgi:hypothetical protein
MLVRTTFFNRLGELREFSHACEIFHGGNLWGNITYQLKWSNIERREF